MIYLYALKTRSHKHNELQWNTFSLLISTKGLQERKKKTLEFFHQVQHAAADCGKKCMWEHSESRNVLFCHCHNSGNVGSLWKTICSLTSNSMKCLRLYQHTETGGVCWATVPLCRHQLLKPFYIIATPDRLHSAVYHRANKWLFPDASVEFSSINQIRFQTQLICLILRSMTAGVSSNK